MKLRKILLFVVFLVPPFLPAQGVWTQMTDFPGGDRAHASAFSIGGTGFVAGGRKSDTPPYVYQSDAYAYDQGSGKWTRLPDLPGKVAEACAFSIGSKGYIIGGRDSVGYRTTMFIWDNTTKTWSETDPLPSELYRVRGVGFSISDKGYIATGIAGNASDLLKDLWQYNPQNGQWLQKASIPWSSRFEAASFVVHDKGYILGGTDVSGQSLSDLCCYNPQTDSWSWGEACPVTPQPGVTGFALGAFGYITGGGLSDSGTRVGMVYQYSSALDTWFDVTPLPSYGPAYGVSFSMNNLAYLTTGFPSGYSQQTWRYFPAELGVPNENPETGSVYPNPATDRISIRLNSHITGSLVFRLTDLTGRILLTQTETPAQPSFQITIPLSGLTEGCYFLTVKSESGAVVMTEKVMKK